MRKRLRTAITSQWRGFVLLALIIMGVPAGRLCAAEATPPAAPAEPDYPPFFTDNIDQTPDFTQSDERARFPNRGFYLCGLVAASNSLMWLAANGYPDLVDNTGDAFQDQVKLVRTLGLPAYTATQPSVGTSARQLMRGVRNYVHDRGYAVRRLEHRGWYRDRQRNRENLVPELDWIKRGMLNKGAVWLSVGFYKYDRSSNRYRRTLADGHWVTLVGYGKTRPGAHDPNALMIHDPSPVAGTSFSTDYVTARQMTSGLVFDPRSRGRPASACYQLLGMKIPKTADVAILEAAVVLQLEPPAAQSTPPAK